MENTIWKPVLGYEGLYEVSNKGEVRSIPRNGTSKSVKILKLVKRTKNDDHLSVGLSKDGKQTLYFVHRIVWEGFNGKIHNGMIINHLDENPLNNNLSNLQLCDHKFNSNYGSLPFIRHTFRSMPVQQYAMDGTFIKEWESAMDACNTLSIDFANIRNCVKGKRKSAGGFIWKCA